jgi:hypothetical protein
MYTWTFPGAPIRINIQLSVILKLQAEAGQARSAGHSRMVGGVLLGESRPPGSVEINDCVFLPSSHPASHPYVLNVSELERVRRERGNSRNGRVRLTVVGYFRTQPERVLALRDDEIELVQKHFHDPSQVVLLIQSSAEQSTAGFLFWDGDSVVPFSLLDFPLDAAALKLEGAGIPIHRAELELAPEAEIGPPERLADSAPKRGWTSGARMAIGAAMLLVVGLIAFILRNQVVPPAKPAASTPSIVESLQLQVEVQGTGLNLRWNPEVTAIAQASEGRLVVTEGDRPQRVVELDAEQLKSGHVYYQASADQVRFRLEVSKDSSLLTKDSILVLLSGAAAPAPTAPGAPKEAPAAPKVIKAVRIEEAPAAAPAANADVRGLTAPATAQGAEARPVQSKSESLPPAAISANRAQDSADARQPSAEPRVSPVITRSQEPEKAPEIRETAKAAPPLASNATPPPVSAPVAIDSSRAPVTRPAANPPAPPASEALPLARPPAANSSQAPIPLPPSPSSLPVPSAPRAEPIHSPTAPSPASPSAASNYVAPVPIKQASPTLTPDVRAEVNSGEGKLVVSVRVAIDASGKVKSAEIAPTSLPVDSPRIVYVKAAAVGAARAWQFRPATLNGNNVASDYTIDFKFR